MHADYLEVAVTIPNGVVAPVRQRFRALGPEGLQALNQRILRRGQRLVSRGARFQAYAAQRHFLGQRSRSVTDARVDYVLETSQPKGRDRVRPQPEWVRLIAELLNGKRSNIQFGYVVRMPWGTKGLGGRDSLRLISDSWCALEPLLLALRGRVR